MNVVVSSRHMELSPALKAHAEQKAEKLSRFYDRISDVEIVFDAGKDSTRVEVIVTVEPKHKFVVHDDSNDAYASIDSCVHKLERQIHEHKDKTRNRKHPGDTDGEGRPVAKM